jgi:hypothetical protein
MPILKPVLRPIHQPNRPNPMPAKTKTKKQVGYLLSKGSPLTPKQQEKLKRELHSKKVKIK